MTDGVILYVTGLAPEIPEDLYMLIKKVASSSFCLICVDFLRVKEVKLVLTNVRPSPSASISSATAKTRVKI